MDYSKNNQLINNMTFMDVLICVWNYIYKNRDSKFMLNVKMVDSEYISLSDKIDKLLSCIQV